MFKIIRNGRKLKGMYGTYESARQEVRRRLRKLGVKDRNRTPSLNTNGFTISKVG